MFSVRSFISSGILQLCVEVRLFVFRYLLLIVPLPPPLPRMGFFPFFRSEYSLTFTSFTDGRFRVSVPSWVVVVLGVRPSYLLVFPVCSPRPVRFPRKFLFYVIVLSVSFGSTRNGPTTSRPLSPSSDVPSSFTSPFVLYHGVTTLLLVPTRGTYLFAVDVLLSGPWTRSWRRHRVDGTRDRGDVVGKFRSSGYRTL